MSVLVTIGTVDINQILIKLMYFCLINNTVNVLKSEHLFYFPKMLKKFCSCKPRPDVVKVVPEILYIAMIDSFRQL